MELSESDVRILSESLRRYKYSLYGEPHLTRDDVGVRYLNQMVEQVDRLLEGLDNIKSKK